ncbi:MAG: D-2-hydroxyacid dehydrogenase [Planctomycetales bacterium]|nr:D-2-hydroxyacid dehydrogenase [Planctomycetales bacterium]
MRIVALDAYTLNPGDLSWESLEALGECSIYDRTPPELVLERAAGAEVVLTNKVPFRTAEFAALPDLKYIGVTATGYNIVDVDAARDRGILVCNAPAYGSQSVAQMAMAHVLNLANGVAMHAAAVREGRWASSPDWCFTDCPLIELEGKTMGVVGLGKIGSTLAKLAAAMGMRVIATSRTAKDEPGIEMVELDTLIRESDVISLHCPLTADTERLINAERISQMKPSALLINTSRGQLVDSQALADALNSGRLAGAGIDTLEQEPPPQDHPLATAKNCYVTPHIAWATQAARMRLLKIIVDNIRAFANGSPTNVVNA